MKALIVFIDFKIAYDSVNHEKMPQILKAYGIPEKFVGAIGRGKLCKSNAPDGETEFFNIMAVQYISS